MRDSTACGPCSQARASKPNSTLGAGAGAGAAAAGVAASAS